MTHPFGVVSSEKSFTIVRVNVRKNGGRIPAQKLRHAVAITHQGALAGARRRVQKSVRLGPAEKARGVGEQLLLIAVGSTLIGVGVGLYLRANLGLPPYDVLLSAIREPLGISHGQTALALSAVLFVVAALFGRRPTIYGLVFTVTNGFAVDRAHALIETPEGMGTRITFVALAMAAIACGIAVATSRPTTGGPFDLLMMAGNDHGFDPYKIRTALEMSVLIGGVLGGGDFGIATVVFALTIGGTMRLWSTALNDHREGRAFRRARAEIDQLEQARARGAARASDVEVDSASTEADPASAAAAAADIGYAAAAEAEEEDLLGDTIVQPLFYN